MFKYTIELGLWSNYYSLFLLSIFFHTECLLVNHMNLAPRQITIFHITKLLVLHT